MRVAFASAFAALSAAGSRVFAIRSGYGWAGDGVRSALACVQPARPIRRPHQRTGQHAGEAQALRRTAACSTNSSGLTQRSTGWWRTDGPQVLRDGDDVAAGVVQIAQRGAHLVGRLAHAEDQVALGDQAVVARRGQHVEAALVAERRPDALEDARHRFDVVRQHFWACLEHLLELFGARR